MLETKPKQIKVDFIELQYMNIHCIDKTLWEMWPQLYVMFHNNQLDQYNGAEQTSIQDSELNLQTQETLMLVWKLDKIEQKIRRPHEQHEQ